MDPEKLKKICLELLDFINYLQLPEWPLEARIKREQAEARIANFLDLDPKDPQFLEKAREEINKILDGELKIESVPRNLDELVRIHEEHKEELKKQREKSLKRTYPTLSEQARNALQLKYANDLLEQLKKSEKQLPEEERILTQTPENLANVSQQIADELAPILPQTARIKGPGALTKDEYRETLKAKQPRIKQILEQRGVSQPEKVAQIFIDQAEEKNLPLAQEVAATPRSFAKEVPFPPKKITPKDLVLPQEVATKLAEPEGIAFVSAYTVLQPQATTALAQKAIFAPPVMVLKAAASEATPEWQEMIRKGVFVEDIEATIQGYRKAGLPEDHPVIQSLEDKKARFLAQQKKEVVRDGKVFYRDRLATRILKRHYLHAKRTGQLELTDKEAGLPFQTSPPPLWSKKEGYSWQLRQFLNATGSGTRFYEPVNVMPGRSLIRFTLPDRIVKRVTFGRFESFGAIKTTIYKKTVGRAVSFFGKKLAKTAIGKAVKAGAKKAVTWVATKVGVQAAVTAAGVATAEVSFGVSLLIAAAVNLAIEIGGKIIGKAWDAIKSIIRDPEKSAVALIGGIAFIALFPGSILSGIIGAGASVIGGLGVISWGAASAGAITSGLAAKIVAFFAILATLPITLPIALFIGVVITTLSAITIFIVITTAGAFILPVGPTEVIEDFPAPATPPTIPPPSGLVFRWPVDSPFHCSSNYGYRKLTIAGKTTCDYHEGIDIPASTGAPVYSTAEGEVAGLGYHSGYGTYIVVKHNGLYSFYAHLLATATSVGAEVGRSTVIGYVDDTGYSTGAHLHFAFSSCGNVPSCFADGNLTPDPCNYVSDANPICPYDCGYHDRATGCPGI